MKRTLKTFAVLLLLLIGIFQTFCSKPGQDKFIKVTSTQLDAVLDTIKTYDYGQSRETLTRLADYVRYVDKSSQVFKEFEGKFINFLQSDATLASKLFICKQLSIIGTEASIPTLQKMLLRQETSDMARYVLQRISGEKVAEIFRESLAKTDGKMKIGIINSLGEIRDKNATTILDQLIDDPDPAVAIAAVAALGSIADEQAATTLSGALKVSSGKLKLRVLDAYLNCAKSFAAAGNSSRAKQIYEELNNKKQPIMIRAAALSGLIRTSGESAPNLILKTIKSGDPVLRKVAIGAIKGLPKTTNITSIAETLPTLNPSAKVQLITALADFGDPVVREIVAAEVNNSNKAVRVATLKSLGVLGNFSTVNLLAEKAASTKGDESQTARASLALLRGENVNQTIVKNLNTAEPGIKVELIRSLGNRYAEEAVEDVLKTSKDPDQKVRMESFKTLSIIADPSHLPTLVDGLIEVQDEPVRREAKKTVTAVALKIDKAGKRAVSLLEKLPGVKEPLVKSSLIEIMGKIADPNCLPGLRKSIMATDESIKIAAIKALSDWPTNEPIDDLLKIAQTSDDEIQQVLALRGFIRLNGLGNDNPSDKTVQNYKTAMSLAKNINEQKMVLSGLAKVKLPAALDMAFSYVDNQSLNQEAEQAVIQISRGIRDKYPDKVKLLLTKIAETTKNRRSKSQATNILKQLQ